MKTNCRSSILLHKGEDYLLITVNRAELLATVKRATTIAPPDSPLDVLKGVLLESDSARKMLTVTSTNLEIALVEKIPCSAQEDGALVYSARTLAEMLQRLPEDTVEISRKENRGRMTLTSGSVSYEVDVWDRGAFPKPDLPFPEDTVKVSGIPAVAQHTVFATAQDKDKPLLRCVNLMFTDAGLRAAGSNGMCIVTAKGDDQSTGDISLLVPALSLGKLAGMCKDEDEFRVGTTGKSIVFFKENFLFSARLMKGGYIDTNSLLKTITNSFTVLTDTKEMREALSSVLSVAPDGRVNLAFEDQKLVFRCSSDWGNASVGIDVIALTGAPTGSYWYSAKQLATCLKALGGTITLGIAQGGMLTISTQDAYYLQNVMRAPTAKKKSKKAIEQGGVKGGMRLEIPKICRYCGGVVRLVPAAEVYGMAAAKRLGIEQERFYQCQNCNARVGCHKGTTRPLGNLANETLRMKRKETHQIFDSFWRERGMTRTQGYHWMAKKLRLSEQLAHIGGFEMDRCQRLIDLCEKERNKEAA